MQTGVFLWMELSLFTPSIINAVILHDYVKITADLVAGESTTWFKFEIHMVFGIFSMEND